MWARKTTLSLLICFLLALSCHAALQLCERVEQASRVLCSSPTRPPSASANNTFLDLHNCSVHTQPHPTIAKYLTASSLAFFSHEAGTTWLRSSYLPNGIMAGDWPSDCRISAIGDKLILVPRVTRLNLDNVKRWITWMIFFHSTIS